VAGDTAEQDQVSDPHNFDGAVARYCSVQQLGAIARGADGVLEEFFRHLCFPDGTRLSKARTSASLSGAREVSHDDARSSAT